MEVEGEAVESVEPAGERGGVDVGPVAVAEAFLSILCSIKL